MKVVATIEARMASTRLPGKVLLESVGKTMLAHLIERLRRVPLLDEVVLATTTNPLDSVLETFAQENHLAYYRGSEDNVMQRVIEAAESVQADIVVEITADCPLIDPEIIEQCIALYQANHHMCDYVSNVILRSYPDGMDVQVYPLAILKHSASVTNHPLHQEHVTMHIVENPALYRHLHLIAPQCMSWPGLGLTLDEPGDYKLISTLMEYFSETNPAFGCREIIAAIKEHPEWYEYNAFVTRKGYT